MKNVFKKKTQRTDDIVAQLYDQMIIYMMMMMIFFDHYDNDLHLLIGHLIILPIKLLMT